MRKNEIKVIELNNESYPVVINLKKIKNTYIRIDDSFNIVINTNTYSTNQQIKNLLKKHQDKIIKMVNNKKSHSLLFNQVHYLGNTYNINMIESNKFSYNILNNDIHFHTQYPLSDTIDLFYKEEAKIILPQQLKFCHTHFKTYQNIPFPRLTIRKMKNRFGTCYYSKNQINLNYRIIKYDVETINYVIYHELCHFIHHNHQKDFYKLLDIVYPNHRVKRKNLNK